MRSTAKVIVTALLGLVLAAAPATAEWRLAAFVRGDADGDGAVRINDATLTLQYIFVGGHMDENCLGAADANDDRRVDVSDAVYTLQYVFAGGPPPPAPFPRAGTDVREDALGCLRYEEESPPDNDFPPDDWWWQDPCGGIFFCQDD